MTQKLTFNEIAEYLLTLPGFGVHTVHTASEHKEKLIETLYQTSDPSIAKELWKKSLNSLTENGVSLLGICSDNGGGIQRGANWGPLYCRKSWYDFSSSTFRNKITDIGDIRVIPHLLHDKYLNKETIKNCQSSLYGNENNNALPVSPLSMAELLIKEHYSQFPNRKIFTLGGDHSISYATVGPYLRHKKERGINTAIIHFDAHTDLLTERLGIDICFGSWCTTILNDLNDPQQLIQLGIRSSGKDKNHWEKTFGVKQFWAHEIEKNGVKKVSNSICQLLKKQNVKELYISFDIDALDASMASATGTPESNGLKLDQCLLFIQLIADIFPITGADLVEVAPHVSYKTIKQINPEPESTLMCASSIMQTILEVMN